MQLAWLSISSTWERSRAASYIQTRHSLCVAFVILALVVLPGLYSAAYRAAFLRSLLRRMLPYGYYVVVFSLFLIFMLLFVFMFLVYLFIFWSLLCLVLATMSFADYFLVCFLLSAFRVLWVFSKRGPGLIWFGSVYLVTTAGFVADQLM